jgi:hypothetical protein
MNKEKLSPQQKLSLFCRHVMAICGSKTARYVLGLGKMCKLDQQLVDAKVAQDQLAITRAEMGMNQLVADMRRKRLMK